MLPHIPATQHESSFTFDVRLESIEDLFYEGNCSAHHHRTISPEDELLRVQNVLDQQQNRAKLLRCFSQVASGNHGMNRKNFNQFVGACFVRALPGEMKAADSNRVGGEIFSCVTNLYARDGQSAGGDTALSASQFAGAVVRLANLYHLIAPVAVNSPEGKQDAKDAKHDDSEGMLASQTERFLLEAV